MNRSWGTVGMLCFAIVMGVGLTGCGVTGATGDQPLTVVPQSSGDAPALMDLAPSDRPAARDELIAAQEQPAGSDEISDVDFHHGRRGGHRVFRMLDLTQDQRQQVRDIRVQLRADVKALRDAAREDIDALLTEEQLAELETLRADRPRFGSRHHGGRGHGLHRFDGPVGDVQRPIDSLDLTEEQQTSIDTIRENLREDVRGLHDGARNAFREILTPEQIDKLDQLHPPAENDIQQSDSAMDG